jgi:hypothetical protein
MKKYFIILLILLSACSTLRKPNTKWPNNQSNGIIMLNKFKGDTLGYVQQNFIDNKQKYIGKDLNTFLKDVEIPIKSYIPTTSSSNRNIIPDT